ncbi:MAG TPA: hydrogenase maturation nickel metallochaperone HypA [Bryobacteraceae bacterium]|jgi:hydrogenase nickel incorporation protein HypA/HybF
MHELSIAVSMIELAQEEAERRGVRVSAIHLKLGPLSGVVRQALEGAYEIACEGTPLAGSRLVIEEVPIVAFCPTCNQRREIPSMLLMQCPECSAPTSEVLEGADLQVTALEVE